VLQRGLDPSKAGDTWLAMNGTGRLGVVRLLQAAPRVDIGVLASLHHPVLAEVLGGGSEPVPHVVREYVPGKPLSAYIMSGAAPAQLALSIAAQAASGLAALHAHGLVHGLLAPGRVQVESIHEPRIRLTGFGLTPEKWQGGLDQAAPECMRGAAAEPAADVYALGLLTWQLVHGSLPFAELGRSQALLRRSREVPKAEKGSAGLRAMLEACLSLEPGRRPGAVELVRSLQDLGARLVAPDWLHLERRARAVTVLTPPVRRSLDRWLEAGGRLALQGSPGSGRSCLLDALGSALRARRRPYLRIGPGKRAWDPVEHALTAPGLPGAPVALPGWPQLQLRAEAAALALVGRCPAGFHLLVDDLDELDEPTRLVLDLLAEDGRVHLGVGTCVAPDWAGIRCVLAPWSREQVAQLVLGVLGSVDASDSLVDQLWTVAGGVPADTARRLLRLVRGGALRWDVVSWRVVEELVPTILDAASSDAEPIGPLGEEARALLGYLACAELPCTVEYLCYLAEVDEERGRLALQQLVDAGLVRVEQRQALPRDARSRALLESGCADLAAVHRRLLGQQLELSDADPVRLGWHLLGARAVELVPAHGAAAIAAASRRNPPDGARLADGLWGLVPHAALAAPRMLALSEVGRQVEALQLGERLVGERPHSAEALAIMTAMACITAQLPDREAEALAWAGRVRSVTGEPPGELAVMEARLHARLGRLDMAIEAARRLADGPVPVALHDLDRWLAMRTLWASLVLLLGELENAVQLLETVPVELGAGRPSRARLDSCLGALLLEAGRLQDAVRAMERATDVAVGLPVLERGRLLRDIAAARHALGQRDEALERWQQAAVLLERAGDPREVLPVLTELSRGLREARRLEEAEAAGRQAYARASELGEDRVVARAALGIGDVFLERGDWVRADRWYRRGAEVVDLSADPDFHAALAERRAVLAVRRRDKSATRLAEEALRASQAAGVSARICRAQAVLALCRARDGQAQGLSEVREQILEPLRIAGDAVELADARLWLAEALLVAGRVDDAERETARALVYAQEVGHTELRARARALGARIRGNQGEDLGGRQLSQLLDLAVAVVREKDTDRLLDRIARSARDLLDGERAFVLLERDGELVPGAAACRRGLHPGRPSMSVVNRALQDGREVIAPDISERADLRDAISVLNMDLGSAMCVPMVDGSHTLGAIYVDSRQANEHDLAAAVRLLRALAAYAAVAVSNARHLHSVSQRAEEAAEIAHDMRSPAASIRILAVELGEQLSAGSAANDKLQRILDAAQRLETLANALLDAESFSRRPLDLSNLVMRASAIEEPAARQAGLRLALDLEPGIVVEGDPLALSRLLANLVGNAVRHGPKGTVVSIRLVAERDMAVCFVRDQGPGFPLGAEEAIFRRGARYGGGKPGHGLGLAIARHIVEQHGGRISARNLERGAEFCFHLPMGGV